VSRRKFPAETDERLAPTNVGGYFINGLLTVIHGKDLAMRRRGGFVAKGFSAPLAKMNHAGQITIVSRGANHVSRILSLAPKVLEMSRLGFHRELRPVPWHRRC